MLETHHRLVVLLEAEHVQGYLEEMTGRERFDYALKNRYVGELELTKMRNMAKGWEKRIDLQEKKLQRELRYREVLEHLGIIG